MQQDVPADIRLTGGFVVATSMHSEREKSKAERVKRVLKVFACVAFLVISLGLWLVSGRSWLVLLLLSLPCYACEEWLGGKIFTEESRWSVSKSGFSIWRVIFGVVVVLLFFGVVFALQAILRKLF